MKVLKFNEFLNETIEQFENSVIKLSKINMTDNEKDILKFLESNLKTEFEFRPESVADKINGVDSDENSGIFYVIPIKYKKQYEEASKLKGFKTLFYNEPRNYVDNGFAFVPLDFEDIPNVIENKEMLLKLIKQNWKFLK